MPSETIVPPLADLQASMVAIAREAGEAILRVYDGLAPLDRVSKGDGSPLTAADLAAHVLIEERLAALTPRIPRLSEESAAVGYADRRHWDCFWLIDPLDGTREFLKHNGQFTVNIALMVHGRPVLGVVHAPVSGVSWSGGAGLGAWKDTPGQARRALQVASPLPGQPVKVAVSGSHRDPRLGRWLDHLGPHELNHAGSALKFGLVAEGAAHLYPRFGTTMEWDSAAGEAVVEGAGGRVVRLEGERHHVVTAQSRALAYNKEDLRNPDFLVGALTPG